MDTSTREAKLKTKKICRFCLNSASDLSIIFAKDAEINSQVPLTVQIMSCAGVEIFEGDSLPAYICSVCRNLMQMLYQYKQLCKQSERRLYQFLASGEWPAPQKLPLDLIQQYMGQQKAATEPVRKKQKVEKVSEVQTRRQSLPPPLPPPPPPPKKEPAKIIVVRNELIKKKSSSPPSQSVPLLVPIVKADPDTKPIILNQVPKKMIRESNKPPIILNRKQKLGANSQLIIANPKIDHESNTVTASVEPSPEDPLKKAEPVNTNCFPCDQCERSFPLRQLLDIHMTKHSRLRNHICDMCQRAFLSKYDLQKHIFTHTKEKPHTCAVCGSSFARSTMLTRHQKTHVEHLKFQCHNCDRLFVCEADREKHEKVHEKRRPFACSQCDKSFAFKQGLERHELTHDKNLPYACEHCNMSFLTAGKLSRHLTAHAGKRPYPCKLCHKSFLLSHHLTRHIRQHHNRGLHQCTECPETFQQQDDLIYHSAVHATENLTCPLCKLKLSSLEEVTAHIQTHSDSIQFCCEYCDLIFTAEQELDEHCAEQHTDEMYSILPTEEEEDEEKTSAVTETNTDGNVEIVEEYIVEEVDSQMGDDEDNYREIIIGDFMTGGDVKIEEATITTTTSERATRGKNLSTVLQKIPKGVTIVKRK